MSDLTDIIRSYGGSQPTNVDAFEAILASRGGRQRSTSIPVRGIGNVLPTSALSDVAIGYANGAAYPRQALYLSPTTLPATDWVVHIAVRLPTSNSFDLPLLTLLPSSRADGFLAGNSQIAIGFIPRTSSRATDPARGSIIVSGKDDAGNWLANNNNRSVSNLWGQAGGNNSIPYLSGPYMETPDGLPTSIFLQKVGGVVQLWLVQAGATALLHDFTATNFGKLTASDGNIGWMDRTSIMSPGVSYQRFFAASGSLTAAQMEGIAQGVDPRQYLPFNQASDRLSNIRFAGNDVQNDLVGSGSIGGFSFNGSEPLMSVQPNLIPSTVLAEMPRVAVENNQVFQRTGVSSDLRLTGRITGADDDVYVQLVDFADKSAVIKPWTKIATSSNGAWVGTISGVPSQLKWYDVQVRKGTAGTVYTVGRRIGVGIVIDWWGQSISEKQRSTTRTGASGPTADFLSVFSRAKSDNGSTQGNTNRGWARNLGTGYGEMVAMRLIAEGANCPVGGVMSAVEGSGIDAWDRSSNSGYIPAADSWQRTRPGYLIWQQGQGSTGVSPANYQVFLDKLLSQTRADFPWAWTFIMGPLNNNGGAANSGGVFTGLRVAQSNWADTNAGARVRNVGSLIDLKLNDTVHPSPEASGQGRISERVAREVLAAEGVVSSGGRGPRFTTASRVADVVELTLVQNGGAGLRTPANGNVTGFEIATEADTSFSNPLGVTSTTIVNATTVQLMLTAVPTGRVRIRYQYGNPGPATTPLDANGMMPASVNPLYDDRAPGLNTTLGFPVQFTVADIVTAT